MRPARIAAVAFTVVCLIVAVFSLTSSTKTTFCTGSECSTVDCGSPAFPKTLIDFDNPDDAANCAGMPSASIALYAALLAGFGVVVLGVITFTARREAVDTPPATSSSVPDP